MTATMIRLAAPLQAYGHTGRFNNRPTAADPSTSAVQGLVAAAAGIGRDRPYPGWLADLSMAVRVDREGQFVRDYHTVNPPDRRAYRDLTGKDSSNVRTVIGADGTRKDDPVLSERWYVADAVFVVAIDDPDGQVQAAMADPVWHLYAGRKSCPLTEPFLLGRIDGAPMDALTRVPTVRHPDESADQVGRRVVAFAPHPEATRHEDRNDRSGGFKRYRRQRRWHTEVRCPAVDDWFAVVDAVTATEDAR